MFRVYPSRSPKLVPLLGFPSQERLMTLTSNRVGTEMEEEEAKMKEGAEAEKAEREEEVDEDDVAEGDAEDDEEAEDEDAEEMEDEEDISPVADQFDLAKLFAGPTNSSVVSTFYLTSKDSLRSQIRPMNGSVLTNG